MHEPPKDSRWWWMADRYVTYALKVLMVVVLACYIGQFVLGFIVRIKVVVAILIGAIFLAYLIYPAVRALHRRVPLVVAILIVYFTTAVLLFALGWYVVPRIAEELVALAQGYPTLSARIEAMMGDPNDPLMGRLPDWARQSVVHAPDQLLQWVKLHGVETAGRAMIVLAGTFAAIATFVIVPLVTAYLLLDLEHLKRSLVAIVPEDRWRTTLELLGEFDAVVGGFVRGQLLVALSVGVLITIAMLLLRVPYAFLLGLLAMIGDLIPYVGAVMAFVPAFMSAFLANGILNAVAVLVAFVLIFEVEGHLLAPNIVGKTVSLSPFVVVLALLVGGDLGGLFGMLVAVPIVGVLRVLAVRVFRQRNANQPTP